ncbi:MAG: flagellar motor protein [candidate division Zixibacteria bacterium]|nr:flagellar motor protein [candidate division Zixibacteria bacterium]
MDLATIGGLILGIGAIIFAYFLDGGHFGAVFQAPAMILVIGGTIGAAMITTSFNTIRNIPTLLGIAFRGKKPDALKTIALITSLADKARREGVLGLEADLKKIKDPFFNKATQLVIDGTDSTDLRQILETEVSYIAERHRKGISLFKALGGFSPTLGIIGTVLGLVHTLSNTDDAARMATAIAGAFIATLWGITMANLIYLPIGDKLRLRHDEEVENLDLIIEGIVSIQAGENPRIIRTKLMSFVDPKTRLEKLPIVSERDQRRQKIENEHSDLELRRKRYDSLTKVD